MEKRFCLALAVALLVPSSARSVDLLEAFERNFRYNGVQTICYDVVADGTNYYLAGFEQTSSNKGYITCYDKRGNKLWEQSIGSSTIFQNVYVDANFVYGLGYASNNGTDGVVVKLDKATGTPSVTWPDTGKGVGVRQYGNNLSNSFNCGLIVGGEFLAAGYQSTGAGDGEGVVVRYTSTGALSTAWPDVGKGVGVRTISGGTLGVDVVYDMGIENNRVTMCGRLYTSSTSSKGFLWKINFADGSNHATWANTGNGVGVRTFMDGGASLGTAYDLAIHGTTTGVCGSAGTDAVVVQVIASGTTNFTYTQGGSGNQTFVEIIPKVGGGYFAVGPDDGQSMICNIQGNGTGAPGWESSPVNGKKSFPEAVNGPNRVVRNAANQPFFCAASSAVGTGADVTLFTVKSDNLVSEVGVVATGQTDNFDSMTMDSEESVAVACSTYTAPVSTSLVRFGVASPVNPQSYEVSIGEEFTGGLATLTQSDNNSLEMFNDPISLMARAEFTFSIPAQALDPTRLIVEVESGVGRPGLAMQLFLRNRITGTWHLRLGRGAFLQDVIFKNTVTSNANQYIDPSGNAEMRLLWAPINDEDPTTDGWTHRVDQVVMTAVL